MESRIGVTPEKLNEKGEDLKKLVSKMKAEIAEMENVIVATEGYWKGKAGKSLRMQYSEVNTEFLEVLNRFEEYPGELQKMAGIYILHDDKALQEAEALPGDVL